MSAWNTSGIGNNIYVRDAFVPLEEANINPAVQKYVSLVTADGGKVSQLGQQATSSFLLWATEAKACGSDLTRQCMINHLSTGPQLDRRRAARPDRPRATTRRPAAGCCSS